MPSAINLRFQSDKQREMLAKIAKQGNRSLNSHILELINADLLRYQTELFIKNKQSKK